MKQLLAVCGCVCIIALVLGTGVASGQLNGVVVEWGSRVVLEPSALDDIAEVTPGGYHFLGLKLDGSIVAWGADADGQCGVPEPNANFVAADGGYYFSLGIKSDGSIVGWGLNTVGQCDVPPPNADFAAIDA